MHCFFFIFAPLSRHCVSCYGYLLVYFCFFSGLYCFVVLWLCCLFFISGFSSCYILLVEGLVTHSQLSSCEGVPLSLGLRKPGHLGGDLCSISSFDLPV